MNKKVLVLFVEGETEVKFYQELIKIIRQYCKGNLDCVVEIKNAGGIGNFKSKVIRIFEKTLKAKYTDAQFSIALCYDQDVFELSKKPPINWNEVKAELENKGASEVYLVKAEKSIEDWFLYDLDGVLNYLHLASNTKISKGNGAERLKSLFKKSNKLYVKGKCSADFVQALNIIKILSQICEEVNPLCRWLGVECNDKQKCKELCKIQ